MDGKENGEPPKAVQKGTPSSRRGAESAPLRVLQEIIPVTTWKEPIQVHAFFGLTTLVFGAGFTATTPLGAGLTLTLALALRFFVADGFVTFAFGFVIFLFLVFD
jgi:hypothetical protein